VYLQLGEILCGDSKSYFSRVTVIAVWLWGDVVMENTLFLSVNKHLRYHMFFCGELSDSFLKTYLKIIFIANIDNVV